MSARAVIIDLGAAQLERCLFFAGNAEIGGASNIRSSAGERMAEISVDQMVGQVGTLALSCWMLGKAAGYAEYARGRIAADRNPTSGDGGADILGTNIDVKSSLHRYAQKSPFEYNLLVRPQERHPGHVFVLGLVEIEDPAARVDTWRTARVHLVGWATNEELRPPPQGDNPFGDAWRLRGKDLHPLPPFRWQF